MVTCSSAALVILRLHWNNVNDAGINSISVFFVFIFEMSLTSKNVRDWKLSHADVTN